jgi:hypothetical protein
MKHYFGKIEIQIGGHELMYSFKFKTDIDPDDYLIMVCSDFFGDSEDILGTGSFSFNGGCIYTSPYDFQEVTQEMWEKTTILNNINTSKKVAV